jgi:hypothetical protein
MTGRRTYTHTHSQHPHAQMLPGQSTKDKQPFGTTNESKSLPIMYALVDIDIKMTRNDNIIPTPPPLPENPQTQGQKRSKTKDKPSTQLGRRETRRKKEKVFRWLAPSFSHPSHYLVAKNEKGRKRKMLSSLFTSFPFASLNMNNPFHGVRACLFSFRQGGRLARSIPRFLLR